MARVLAEGVIWDAAAQAECDAMVDALVNRNLPHGRRPMTHLEATQEATWAAMDGCQGSVRALPFLVA